MTNMKVFEPMKINGLELKNRMVVSAMVTNYCTPDGKATEKFYCLSRTQSKRRMGRLKAIGS